MKTPRFPNRQESITLLLICIFPIHFWALFIFLHDLPGYLMHYNAIQIASILAYVMGFAFLESLFAAGMLYLLAGLLSKKGRKDHLIAQSLVFMIVTAIWMAAAQFWIWNTINSEEKIVAGNQLLALPPWLIGLGLMFTYIACLWWLSAKLRQSNKFEALLQNSAERLTVLSTLFLIVDALSIALVIVQNIG